MTPVDLPVVASSTNLDSALQQLRDFQRSALLVESEGNYNLLTAAEIAVCRTRGIRTLGELNSTVKLQPYEPPVRATFPAEKSPGIFRLAERAVVIASESSEYAFKGIAGNSVFLNISNANIASRLMSRPKDLYCDGPRQHDDFPPPNVSEGDPCPHNDGHTVISAR